MDFKVSHLDPCIFICHKNSNTTFISSHVNDLGLFCNSKKEIATVQSKFLQHIKIKDSGEIKTILWIEVTHDCEKCTISLSHQQYIINMVTEYNQTNSKPIYMPMEEGTYLSQVEFCLKNLKRSVLCAPFPTRTSLATLNHTAVMTWPDISKVVQPVAQFSSNPGMRHWNTALCIVKYLNTMKDWVLNLGSKLESKIPTFIAYSDVNHANHPDHGWSISGYGILNVTCNGIGGVHAWCSRKQTSTALSTHEAEYISSVNTSHKVVWQHKLYSELGFVQRAWIHFFTNNNSALKTINSPDQVTNCTKHIHYNYHWIKEVACKHVILLEHVPSELSAADIFTKAFHAPWHKEFCRMLGMRPWNNAC